MRFLSLIRAGFTLYMVTIIEIYSVKPAHHWMIGGRAGCELCEAEPFAETEQHRLLHKPVRAAGVAGAVRRHRGPQVHLRLLDLRRIVPKVPGEWRAAGRRPCPEQDIGDRAAHTVIVRTIELAYNAMTL